MVSDWWLLLDEITTKFRDGVILQSPHPPLKQKHVFYPIEWLREVGFFSRPPLPEPHYPPVPEPSPRAQAQRIAAVAAEQKQSQKRKQVQIAMPAPAVSNSLVDDREDDLTGATWGDPSQPTDEQTTRTSQPQSGSSDDDSFTSRLRSRWVAVSLFSAVVVLLSCVCFLLGKAWGSRQRRAEYERIADDVEYPSGGRPWRSHDTVQSGPFTRLSTR